MSKKEKIGFAGGCLASFFLLIILNIRDLDKNIFFIIIASILCGFLFFLIIRKLSKSEFNFSFKFLLFFNIVLIFFYFLISGFEKGLEYGIILVQKIFPFIFYDFNALVRSCYDGENGIICILFYSPFMILYFLLILSFVEFIFFADYQLLFKKIKKIPTTILVFLNLIIIIYFFLISFTSFSGCQLVVSTSGRDSCYGGSSQEEEHSLDYCLKIKEDEMRYRCLENREITEDECGTIEDINSRDYCYKGAGIRKNDIDICNKIDSEEKKGQCYEDVAFNMEKPSLCEDIKQYPLRESCYERIKQKGKHFCNSDKDCFSCCTAKGCTCVNLEWWENNNGWEMYNVNSGEYECELDICMCEDNKCVWKH